MSYCRFSSGNNSPAHAGIDRMKREAAQADAPGEARYAIGDKPRNPQVDTPEFKRWFGDWERDPENASKVVDENGEPLAVYHGTDENFDEFDPENPDIRYSIKKGNPQDEMRSPTGSRDFGQVSEEQARALGKAPAPIRLLRGNDRWGARHIEARHGREIRTDPRYRSVEKFVHHVVSAPDAIYEGNNERVILTRKEGIGRLSVLELRKEKGGYYSVVTAYHPNPRRFKNRKPLWSRTASRSADGTNPSVALSKAVTEDIGGSERLPASGPSGFPDSNIPPSGESGKRHVDEAVAAFRKGFPGAADIPIRVAATAADLPDNAPAEVEGAALGGEVWLVAENLPSRERAEEVLLHEIVGHIGLARMMGLEELRSDALSQNSDISFYFNLFPYFVCREHRGVKMHAQANTCAVPQRQAMAPCFFP